MKTLGFPASTLRAAMCCAAKKDVRHYLNGVYLHSSKARIVATDGHVMFVGHLECAVSGTDFPDIIVPRAPIDLAMKSLGNRSVATTGIEFRRHDDGTFDLYTLAGTFPFTPVDDPWMEYGRVVPTHPDGGVAQFDPDLLDSVREALQWYTGRSNSLGVLAHNGNGPALYTSAGITAFCVVMPIRAGEPDALEWYRKPIKEAA